MRHARARGATEVLQVAALPQTARSRPKKRFGQNFIRDTNLVAKIVREADLRPGDTVLEIGPGEGSMTDAILEAGCEVVAVEIDRDLIPLLQARFEGNPQFRLVQGDILEADLPTLMSGTASQPAKVVANLPYYITTPILFKLLEEGRHLFESITVMVQKEVAQRIVAPPGGKDYGSLTVAIAYYTSPRIRMHLPSTVFHPRPNVDSCVVTLTVHQVPVVQVADEAFFFRVVKAAFAQRRKTIRNTLISGLEADFSPEAIACALEAAGIDATRRGETLSILEYARLSDILQGSTQR